jgi:hypothetical protein
MTKYDDIDPNSMTYHVQAERLKRLLLETIRDADIDPGLLTEEEVTLMINYIDSLCVSLSNMDELIPEEERENIKVGFLIKAIVANAAKVLILQRQS